MASAPARKTESMRLSFWATIVLLALPGSFFESNYCAHASDLHCCLRHDQAATDIVADCPVAYPSYCEPQSRWTKRPACQCRHHVPPTMAIAARYGRTWSDADLIVRSVVDSIDIDTELSVDKRVPFVTGRISHATALSRCASLSRFLL
ncbi:MAG: hypothetical protein ACIALR_17080 [Blastopirellula sp. JB062]